MTQTNCPHFEGMKYTDRPTVDPQDDMILRYPFSKPQNLEVRSDAGGMCGREPMRPTLLQIYDGAESGENMEYPAEGECTIVTNVVLVTRKCFEKFCSGNQGNCPRFLKTTDSSPNSA